MDAIRKAFIRQYHLKGSVKIAYFGFQYVYIDFLMRSITFTSKVRNFGILMEIL